MARQPPHSVPPPVPTPLLPGEYRPRFVRVFTRYTRGLFTRKFHAVRLAHGGRDTLAALASVPGPVIVLLNHASWWDPLVCVIIGNLEWTGRTAMAPIDVSQLRRFGFFRKLGLFGVDPSAHDGVRAMSEYVSRRFEHDPRPTLWITPQGRFTDAREPVRLRPGAAAIAARWSACRVVCVAIEYSFWLDQRPEVFMRVEEITPPRDASGYIPLRRWLAAMTSVMQRNADQLASLVMARDPGCFECVLGGGSARINPLYDWWLNLRGKSGAIQQRRRSAVP